MHGLTAVQPGNMHECLATLPACVLEDCRSCFKQPVHANGERSAAGAYYACGYCSAGKPSHTARSSRRGLANKIVDLARQVSRREMGDSVGECESSTCARKSLHDGCQVKCPFDIYTCASEFGYVDAVLSCATVCGLCAVWVVW